MVNRDLAEAEPLTVPLHVVSLYGRSNAGDRARALTFLDRLGHPYDYTSYFPGNAAGSRQFLRSPGRSVAAEHRLRKLIDQPPQRLLLRREASPLSKGSIECALLDASAFGVYDLDDALHHDVRRPGFERLFSKATKARRAVEAADRVIVGNSYLADWASHHAEDVRLIPTCVAPNSYAKKSDYSVSDRPRLVWLGTRSGEGYLRMVEGSLLRLNARTGGTLSIVGSTVPWLGPLEDMITRIPWSRGEVEKRIRNYDVGLMPLADSPYERGKCAYKLLEYGSAGLPAIGSPVGVNKEILGAAGWPAPPTPRDWDEALDDILTRSPLERSASAGRMLRHIEDRFSFDRWQGLWGAAVLTEP